MGIFDTHVRPGTAPTVPQQPAQSPQPTPQQPQFYQPQSAPPGFFPQAPQTPPAPPAPPAQHPAVPQSFFPPGMPPAAPQGYPPPQNGYGQPAPPAAPSGDAPTDDDDGLGNIADAALKAGGTRYPQLFMDGACTAVVCIDRTKYFKTRKKFWQYTVELHIVASNAPGVTPGSPRTYMEQSCKEGWESRVARYIMGVTGLPAKEIDESGTRATYHESQPLSRMLVAVDLSPNSNGKKDANTGRPFLNTNFRPLNAAEFAHFAQVEKSINPQWEPNPLQPSLRFAQHPVGQ